LPFLFPLPIVVNTRFLFVITPLLVVLGWGASLAQVQPKAPPLKPKAEAKVGRKVAKAEAQREGLNVKDAEAERVLQKARARMNTATDFSATFKYELENKAAKQKAVVKVGSIKVKRERYRVDFSDQLLVCDGKTIWNYLRVENECNISTYDPNEGFSFDRIFKVYNEDMKARYERVDRVAGVATDRVMLFPVKANTEYFRVELWIAQRESVPVRMRVYARNGSVVTYDLSQVKLNTGVPDAEFTFQAKAHPGVELVDLR
jgi:outer membrane lipoprotein carrier protein